MSIHHTIHNSVRLSGTSAPTGAALPSRAILAGGMLLSGAALLAACRAPEAVSAEAAPPVKADVGAAPQSVPSAAARALPDFCQGASAEPLPSPAQVERIKDGFVFVEGPVWSEKAGAFFFSEMDFNSPGPNGPPSKIHQLVLPATFSVFIASSGSNGLAVDATGLVACTHDSQSLSRYDLSTHERSVFVGDFQGKHFNSPNDVALHSAGYAYFTDPDWQLPPRKSETGITGVYFRNAAGEVRLVDASLKQPNGISLSPDETRLYVGASETGISVFPVLADGSVGPRQHFADVKEPDGMAVDCAGRLYVANHGAGEVVVFSPDGATVATIPVAPKTTNLAFGGPDHRTLLITAGTGIYALKSSTPGFPY